MQTRQTLLRGASVFALATAILGTSLVVPPASTAAAAPVQRVNDNDGESEKLSDVPIIGDIVGTFEDAEPEEIATGAIQFTAAAAETVVPIVIRLFK